MEVDGSGICVAERYQDVVGGVGPRHDVIEADRQGGDLACPPAAQGSPVATFCCQLVTNDASLRALLDRNWL